MYVFTNLKVNKKKELPRGTLFFVKFEQSKSRINQFIIMTTFINSHFKNVKLFIWMK